MINRIFLLCSITLFAINCYGIDKHIYRKQKIGYLDVKGYAEIINSEIYHQLNVEGPKILIENSYANEALLKGETSINKITGSAIKIIGNAEINAADSLDFIDVIGQSKITYSTIGNFKSTDKVIIENSQINIITTNSHYVHLWNSETDILNISNYDKANQNPIIINLLNNSKLKELNVVSANNVKKIHLIVDASTEKIERNIKKNVNGTLVVRSINNPN